MVMRLLPKKEINIKKAEAQRIEIEQGKSLAKRVDRLREVAAAEEQSLEQFRTKTLEQINTEITGLSEKRDLLVIEVRDLEEKKTLALQPIDKELTELDEKKQELTALDKEIQGKIDTLNRVIAQANELSEKAQKDIALAETMKEAAETRLLKADELLKTNQEVRIKLDQDTLQFREEKKKVEESFAQRQVLLDNKEDRLSVEEEQIQKERHSLHEERIRLADLAGTLERSFIRLRKQK